MFQASGQRDHSSLTNGRFLLGIPFLGKRVWRRRNDFTRKLEEAVPLFRRGTFLRVTNSRGKMGLLCFIHGFSDFVHV